MSATATAFEPLEGTDPARPGDPFSRLRYQYGQLLGAEDFSAEQRYFVLRERLLNAALHGVGTAWGLRVTAREDVIRLHHADGGIECAPGELDADGEGGEDPRRAVGDSGGGREEHDGEEACEQDDSGREGDAAC